MNSLTFGSFGETLFFQGGNSITVGAASIAGNNSNVAMIMPSNGNFFIEIGSATSTGNVVTLNGATQFGPTATTIGIRQFDLYAGNTLNVNNSQTFGIYTQNATSADFNINGGILDNTSGVAITEVPRVNFNLNGNLEFKGTNALTFTAGSSTVNGNNTITVDASTLSLIGTTVSSGSTLTKAGGGTLTLASTTLVGNSGIADTSTTGGTFNLGGIFVRNAGNTISNHGTATLAVGGITSNSGGSVDFDLSGTGPITTSATMDANSHIISVFATVNNGTDFAANTNSTGGTGNVVSQNSRQAERSSRPPASEPARPSPFSRPA